MTKPTIVLLPGAWLKAVNYQPLTDALRQAGFPVITSDYPSLDPQGIPDEATCAKDADFLRDNCVRPAVENDGKDVVLLMHSYAGMPGAAAAHGLAKRDRMAKSLSGGVVGLIMVSAFVIGEGVSCAGGMGGDTPPWVLKDNPSKGLCWPKDPRGMFLADVPSNTAEAVVKQLVPHATIAFFSPQPAPAFAEPGMMGLSAYIMLQQDKAVPTAGQEAMMQYSGQAWETRKLDTSHHMPLVSQTDNMVKTVEELISLFETRIKA